jgi:cytochrome c-type biogenesis protein CcmH
MKLKISLGILFLNIIFYLFPLYTIEAQEPTPSDDEVNAIAKQLYCPVCENIPLDVCPTQACEQWRGTIREKLALGWDEDQIKEYFVAQYGDRVLATPPARGLNWLVYVLPPLVILAGAVVLFRLFRSWSTKIDVEEPTPELEHDLSHDPYVAQLEEELRRREQSGEV